MLFGVIWGALRRVAGFFAGRGDSSDVEECSPSNVERQGNNDQGILSGEAVPVVEYERSVSQVQGEDISSPLIFGNDDDSPVDVSRWTVTEHVESPFEKVGRIYLESEWLVIRSDLDRRGFRVLLVDVEAVLDGEVTAVRLLGADVEVGMVKLSFSGRAMNFRIGEILYTTPLAAVVRILDGGQRKAPLFVGREVVER